MDWCITVIYGELTKTLDKLRVTNMAKSEMQIKLDDIIKEVINPVLKGYGFKRSGRNFYKELDRFGLCFNIQSSLYNTEEDVRFAFNLGIFIPETYTIYFNYPIPKFPKEYDCINRERIGKLNGDRHDWYILNGDIDINELKDEIHQAIINIAISYFEKYKTLEEVLDILFIELKIKGDPQHISQLAIGLFLYRDKEKGQKLFQEHYKLAGNEAYRETLRRVAGRVGFELS
jgi:hypothetical protein